MNDDIRYRAWLFGAEVFAGSSYPGESSRRPMHYGTTKMTVSRLYNKWKPVKSDYCGRRRSRLWLVNVVVVVADHRCRQETKNAEGGMLSSSYLRAGVEALDRSSHTRWSAAIEREEWRPGARIPYFNDELFDGHCFLRFTLCFLEYKKFFKRL